jgi:hypothetical protein
MTPIITYVVEDVTHLALAPDQALTKTMYYVHLPK